MAWKRVLLTTVALLVATAFLAACDVGFDPGMTKRCAATWRQTPGDPKNFAIQDDCPGDINAIIASGNYWDIGSNAPYGDGQYCGGGPGMAFPIASDGSKPLKFGFIGSGPDMVNEVGIVKDSCSTDRSEISFGVGPSQYTAVNNLQEDDDISLMSSAGFYSVHYASVVYDLNGHRYGVQVVVHPTAGLQQPSDPRWNYPASCVFYKGGTDHAGTTSIALDGNCFNVGKMTCNQCGYGHVHINWNDVYNWIFRNHPTWIPEVQAAYPTLQMQFQLGMTVFRRDGSDTAPRARIWHEHWHLYYP